VLILSGGRPKKEGMVKTLAISLGPDFMTDIVTFSNLTDKGDSGDIRPRIIIPSTFL